MLKKILRLQSGLLASILLFSSCGGGGSPPPGVGAEPRVVINTPYASGETVFTDGNSTIDASNAESGYVMVSHTQSDERIKFQVITPKERSYNYDLVCDGEYSVFPLSEGSGKYTLRFMQNVDGSKYAEVFSAAIDAELLDETTPFLYPNQRVNYDGKSLAVAKSGELTAGMTSELDKIEAIYKYVTKNISYDEGKASSVQAGYISDPDSTLQTGTGICLDYAVLVAVMLRVQEIPVKVIYGKVAPHGGSHAWNLIYTKESGVIAVKLSFDAGSWKLVDATYGAEGSVYEKDIEKFIGNGTGYTQEFVY
ncbi:MAG: transglutaminase domain-containing protein [Oscillospiraceae bacterium]|jgi:transglutaminase-like putative cysteine protease|nr:transglutaminase domain-containing protein [Oscillospiraceae bacterium]